MNELVEKIEDRLADFTRDKRVIALSCMALIVGALSALVAYVLVWLIAVITNIAFYEQFSSRFQSLDRHQLGHWVVLVPVVGGVIIGLMARYSSEKIRGHGIPEALEAILFGRSRMEPKVAVLKPLSSVRPLDWHGRSVRRGRPDHHDWRRRWIHLRAMLSSFLRRAKNAAGRRSGRGHVRYLYDPGGGLVH